LDRKFELITTKISKDMRPTAIQSIAAVCFVLVLAAFHNQNNDSSKPANLLARRVVAGGFNYTSIKQTVVSLRALQELDPDYWSPYLQAVYDNAKPNKKYCSPRAPAYSQLVFMKHIVFHGQEDDEAVMYFVGLQKDSRALNKDIRDLFVAMRRNVCGFE